MAIVETEYLKYNSEEHFHYLTEAGLIKYTGYEYLVDLWKPSAKVMLEKMGRALHSLYTNNYHNNKEDQFKHRDLIQYNISLNANGEVTSIINALTYMIELEENVDWFSKYLAGETKWPKSIINMLKQSNVYVIGEMVGFVPTDEFEVGY